VLIPVTPADPVVTKDDAKLHLRVDHTDDDAYISSLIGVATTAAAERLERTLGLRTWDLRLDSEDVRRGFDIRLPGPPLVEVLSVKYRDTDGAEQTLAPANYHVYGIEAPYGGRIRLKSGVSWPSMEFGPEAVTVRYKAGYAEVPEPIKQAILLMIGDLYASRGEKIRGEMVEEPTIKALLAPYRMWGV